MRTCKLCKERTATPKHKYCFNHAWQQEAKNKQRTDFQPAAPISEYDCPIRLDKLISIAINEAF